MMKHKNNMAIVKQLTQGFFLCVFCFSTAVAKAPQKKVPDPPRLLNIQHWVTPNGAKVLFIRSTNLPMLDVEVLFHAGSAYDGAAHGLAMLTNNALLEDTQALTAKQIHQQLEAQGTQLSALVSRQTAEIDMRCLSQPEPLAVSINLLQKVIGMPLLSDASINLIKGKMRASLAANQEAPAEVAFDHMMLALFPGQPYAHRPLGDVEAVNSITAKQVKSFYKEYYTARNATLLLVGDLGLQQAKQMAAQLTALLQPGSQAAALPPAQPASGGVQHINFPSRQTHVILAQVGVGYHSHYLAPLEVANYILGGSSLNSKLFSLARNQYGLVYSIHSYLAPTSYNGMWAINFQSSNEHVHSAERLVRRYINNYLKQGPSSDEVAGAIKSLRGQQLLNLSSHANFLQALSTIATYRLPLNYYAMRERRLSQVTVAQVRAALKNVFKPTRWSIITVGGNPSRRSLHKKKHVPVHRGLTHHD